MFQVLGVEGSRPKERLLGVCLPFRACALVVLRLGSQIEQAQPEPHGFGFRVQGFYKGFRHPKL